MKKLEAATLTELIVVMLLSSLLLIMAYTTWQRAEQQYQQFAHSTKEGLAVGQFHYALTRNFRNAQVITLMSHRPLIIVFTQDMVEVSYRLESRYLIRTQTQRQDTFPITQAKLTGYRFGKQVLETGVQLDEIALMGEYQGKTLTFHFRKPDAATSAFAAELMLH